MKERFICSVLVIILLTSEIFSQSITVSGRVTAGEEAVKNAGVTFVNENDTTKKYSTVTDTLGNYRLEIIITGIKEENNTQPVKFELGQNYPNPFTGETAIPYNIKESAAVEIQIYNILGQEVKRITVGEQAMGSHIIKWDGRNNAGVGVSPGIYFYRLNNEVKKMMYGVRNSERLLNKAGTAGLLKDSEEISYETYITRIENSDSTIPLIYNYETLVQITGKDTIIDFQTEAAEQWRLLGLENEIVSAIAINPEDPAIIYAGSSFNSGPGKMFKSTNSGKTWDTLFTGGNFNKIIIDPENHNRIYASPGIIESEDGGLTWQRIMDGIELNLDTGIWSFDVNMKNPCVMYAGTGGFSGGAMYRSDDRGLHWSRIPGDSLNNGVSIIVVDQIDTSTVYAGTAYSGTLWKSTDSGKTWHKTGLGDTGLRISDIFINPADPNEVYVGLSKLGLMKSVDGGATWNSFNDGLPENFSVVKIKKAMDVFILIVTLNDLGWVYEYSNVQEGWARLGINTFQQSFYYSDMAICPELSEVYLGNKGVYVLKYNK